MKLWGRSSLSEAICRQQRIWLAGLLTLVAAASLYLWTLDDGLRLAELQGGDLITHQYAQVQARPSNAPGYPLYTMGGWLWFRLGRALPGYWLNPIQVLSLYSTFWALAALLVFYILLLEVTDQNWLISALCTVFLAVTYFFWYYAITTEEYSSAVLHTLLIIWAAFHWEKSRKDSWLYLLAFLLGLALAHMVTVLLIAPALFLFWLQTIPSCLTPRLFVSFLRQKRKLLARSLLLMLLPLLSYLYVYIRGAQHPEWRGAGQWPTAWHWFWSFVSIQQGRSELTWRLGPFTSEFPSLIWGEVTVFGLVLGVVGLLLLGRRRATFLYSTLAFYFVFCYIDRYGNWYQVWMPMYPVLILGLGVLAARLWRWSWGGKIRFLAARRSLVVPIVIRIVVIIGLTVLIAYRFALSLPRADQSNRPDDDGLQAGWSILADKPAPGALIAATAEETLSLNYVTQIWGVRSDITAINPEAVVEALAEGSQPVYLTRTVAPLAITQLDEAHLSAVGPTLIAVNQKVREPESKPLITVNHDFEVGLRLLGLDARRSMSAEYQTLDVLLYWQADRALTTDYTISVRPACGGQWIYEDGRLVLQDHQPVWGLYPTSRWSPGEVVTDAYQFFLAPKVELDGLTVLVYQAVEGGFEDVGWVSIALPF